MHLPHQFWKPIHPNLHIASSCPWDWVKTMGAIYLRHLLPQGHLVRRPLFDGARIQLSKYRELNGTIMGYFFVSDSYSISMLYSSTIL